MKGFNNIEHLKMLINFLSIIKVHILIHYTTRLNINFMCDINSILQSAANFCANLAVSLASNTTITLCGIMEIKLKGSAGVTKF